MREDGRIYFTPAAQVLDYLKQLQRIGVYGKKRGVVINHILGEEFMRLIKQKIVTPIEIEPPPEDDEAGE